MTTVSVHALSSGYFTMLEHMIVSMEPGTTRTIPSLSFLIQHRSASETSQGRTTRIVYDLGLRRNLIEYNEALYKRLQNRKPVETVPCVVDSLKKGYLQPNDIDYIVLSHAHFDHIGTPWHFPRSTFLVGHQTLGLLDGSIQLAGSQHNFEQVGLPLERTVELPPTTTTTTTNTTTATSAPPTKVPATSELEVPRDTSGLAPDLSLSPPWQALGPFPHALDVFDDQSLYIVSAPGHVPGHIIVVARTSTFPLRWVLLAGDAVHDQDLLDGMKEFGTWTDPVLNCLTCLHADQEVAKMTISKLRQVRDEGLLGGEVEIVFAHDVAWDEDAKKRGRFWPGCL